MMVGRLLSYWEGNFSGAMLNFGRVTDNPFENQHGSPENEPLEEERFLLGPSFSGSSRWFWGV